MRLRTRTPSSSDGPGGVTCDMCGRDVAIGADGRCALGHRVPGWSEQAADDLVAAELAGAAQDLAAAQAVPAEPGVPAERGVPAEPEAPAEPWDVGDPARGADYLDQLQDLGFGTDGVRAPVAPAPAPAAFAPPATGDHHHHPYDDVLSWGPPQPPAATAPAAPPGLATAPVATAPVATAPVATDPAGPPVQERSPFVDEFLNGYGDTAQLVRPLAAAPQPAPPLAGMAAHGQLAPEDDIQRWMAMSAREEAEDARIAARHRLAALGGGILVGAFSTAAVSLAFFA